MPAPAGSGSPAGHRPRRRAARAAGRRDAAARRARTLSGPVRLAVTEADIVRAVADGIDVNKTRIHDLLTARPAAIPAAASIRDAARTMVNGGFRQLPVTDGTGWIGIVDIADVCGVLLAPPVA
jgi:CBS domain-containing protein